jgi:hypothetical protein
MKSAPVLRKSDIVQQEVHLHRILRSEWESCKLKRKKKYHFAQRSDVCQMFEVGRRLVALQKMIKATSVVGPQSLSGHVFHFFPSCGCQVYEAVPESQGMSAFAIRGNEYWEDMGGLWFKVVEAKSSPDPSQSIKVGCGGVCLSSQEVQIGPA